MSRDIEIFVSHLMLSCVSLVITHILYILLYHNCFPVLGKTYVHAQENVSSYRQRLLDSHIELIRCIHGQQTGEQVISCKKQNTSWSCVQPRQRKRREDFFHNQQLLSTICRFCSRHYLHNNHSR